MPGPGRSSSALSNGAPKAPPSGAADSSITAPPSGAADNSIQAPLIETVVTTTGSDGVVNCAAMGVRSGTGERQPLGLCRARHAAVEASILASRLKWLGADHVRAELARLQELVDKTAGPRERAAMDYVRRHVAERT